jgi:hypothetical protein
MNIKTLRGAVSYDIAQGIRLRRATDAEVEEIQKTLNTFPDPMMPLNIPLPRRWEHTWRPAPLDQGPGQHQLAYLPSEEWRYHVIAAAYPRHEELLDLIPALDLARTELEIGFTRIFEPQPERPPEIDHFIREYQSRIPNFVEGRLHGYNGPRYIQFMRRSFHAEYSFLEIGQDEAGEIAETLTTARDNREQTQFLKRHLKELNDLKGLTFESPLRFLGYFAVLESLLTHQPKPTDPYDSITRQIKTKLKLLNHKFPRPIDYGPFGNESPDKIWNKMYDYRSRLAHGGEPDFVKQHNILRNHEAALNLVKEAVKATIRFALHEPQLVEDLRDC